MHPIFHYMVDVSIVYLVMKVIFLYQLIRGYYYRNVNPLRVGHIGVEV